MSKEQLIYDLIFGEKTEFAIDIGEFVSIHDYDDFVNEIKTILRKSKVSIAKSSIDVDSETITWKLKVKK